MLRRIDLRGFEGDLAEVLPRPAPPSGGPVDAVREILAEVEARGDAAVLEFTQRFDGVELASLTVPAAELSAAVDRSGARPGVCYRSGVCMSASEPSRSAVARPSASSSNLTRWP